MKSHKNTVRISIKFCAIDQHTYRAKDDNVIARNKFYKIFISLPRKAILISNESKQLTRQFKKSTSLKVRQNLFKCKSNRANQTLILAKATFSVLTETVNPTYYYIPP